MTTTIREVSGWYYLAMALLFEIAVLWAVRRRACKLGLTVLLWGAGFNLAWESALFLVWGRAYESPLPAPIHFLFQGLTEFGPIFLILILIADRAGWLRLDAWRDPKDGGEAPLGGRLALIGLGAGVAALTVAWVVPPDRLVEPVRVYRLVGASFFATEAFLVLAALALVARLRSGRAAAWFLAVGGLNVAVEAGGLLLGLRTYVGGSSLLSFLIGFGEGGAAACFTWLIVEYSLGVKRAQDSLVAVGPEG